MGKVSAKIFDLKGKKVDRVRLSPIFKTPARPDVIKRAVVAIQSHRFSPRAETFSLESELQRSLVGWA